MFAAGESPARTELSAQSRAACSVEKPTFQISQDDDRSTRHSTRIDRTSINKWIIIQSPATQASLPILSICSFVGHDR